MKICIDPGHGGYDPGAVGPSGLREKDVTLAVALLLADLLRQAGCEVFLTRTGDTTSWTPEEDLQRRCDLANQAGADLFISIHANAAGNPAATGTETYCYRRGGQGERVAAAIQQQLVAALGLPDRGVKTASFYVLQHTAMAAVLAELAFISNPREEALLSTPAFQQQAARAIAQAIGSLYGFYPEQELDPLLPAVTKLQQAGVIETPEYWLQNAVAGRSCKGEYVARLLKNMASKL
jgi:N-acetylmuramoyl-L-alanine amidase